MEIKVGEYTVKAYDGVLTVHDSNDNCVHYKDSKGDEIWRKYDIHQNITYCKHSDGVEQWWEYDENGHKTHYHNSVGNDQWWYNGKGERVSKQEFDKLYETKTTYTLRNES